MKAVIMAGGKGTRIASVTNDEIPKPMLKIGGKPILEYQIECLKSNGVKEIILVIGHLGNVISDYFGDGSNFAVKIEYIKEDAENPLGTAGSLYYLRGKLDDDFILVFGDVFFDIDFRRMLSFHRSHQALATLLTHPNAHPFDSDLIIVNDADVVTGFDSKENDRDTYDYHNIVNSGIYVLSPKVLEAVTEPRKMSLEKDVIQKYIEDQKVYSYHSTEYVKDMGTPERYEAVNRDYKNKIPQIRNLKNRQKCIFLDRDGTINKSDGYITNKEKLVLLDGVAEAIKKINASEYLCIILTNQPVIARGDCSEEELDEIHAHLETLLGKEGAYVDGIFYCPHHPDKGFPGERLEYKINCDCRKPGIGMVKKAEKCYNIDLESSYMIGDSWRDIEMGKNARMHTFLVGNDMNDARLHLASPGTYVQDLLSAVREIIK